MPTFYMCKKLLQQMFPIEKQLWNKNSCLPPLPCAIPHLPKLPNATVHLSVNLSICSK